MQSQDELGNIKQLVPIDLGNGADLVAKIKTAEEKGAKLHTIGRLPKQGENLIVNGLSYRVLFADFVKGKFTIKLICRDE